MSDRASSRAESGAAAVATYIRAKDANRPELMADAFTDDATLEMVVNTRSISFPPLTVGRASITDVLVRRFGETYENVRTFCLSGPPRPSEAMFSCAWLVGMSERNTKDVRVGCGRYDWWFRSGSPYLAERLVITVDLMQVLPPGSCPAVMEWLRGLPYPWCEARLAVESAPKLAPLRPIIERLR